MDLWKVAAAAWGAIVILLIIIIGLATLTGSTRQVCENGSWVVYQGPRAVAVDGDC